MKMKFFNSLADIQRHYDDILLYLNNNHFSLLETWNIFPEDQPEIEEEAEAIRFLLACQLGLARGEHNAVKPSLEVVFRLFEREFGFLEDVHKCHAGNHTEHRLKNIQKRFKACRHYAFKFSLPAWYEKLPAEILTYEAKYKKFDLTQEKELEI